MIKHWFNKDAVQSSSTISTSGTAPAMLEGVALITAADTTINAAQREAALARVTDETDLKRVAQWAAEHDKRLYRLATTRLQDLRSRAQAAQQAEALLAQYQQWLGNDVLALNRLAELDHAWSALEKNLTHTEWPQRHAEVRSALEQRVLARVQLQQHAHSLRNQLEGLRADIDSAGSLKLDELGAQLTQTAAHLPELLASKEISVLSSQQLTALDEALRAAQQALQDRQTHWAQVTAQAHVSRAPPANAPVAAAPAPKRISAREKRERAEQQRLRDWRQFGGEVVRQGLIDEAGALSTQSLAPAALAHAVKQLRARWKALDAQMGAGAPTAWWKRFDAACEQAYAPAAAWFAEQVRQRELQAQQRDEYLQQAEQQARELLATEPRDWRKIVSTIDHWRQRWRALGAVPKEAAQRFEAALSELQTQLHAQRQTEEQARLDLIQRAQALADQTPIRFSSLRALQEEWQTRAKRCPLAAPKEQALWQIFRQACETVAQSLKQSRQAERERVQTAQQARDQALQRTRRIEQAAIEKIIAATAQNLAPSATELAETGALRVALEQRYQQPKPLSATFRDDLIRLELEAGLPSPGDETRRRELQISLLAQKMKGERWLSQPFEMFLALLPQQYNAGHAERLVALLRRYPQWVHGKARAAQPPSR